MQWTITVIIAATWMKNNTRETYKLPFQKLFWLGLGVHDNLEQPTRLFEYSKIFHIETSSGFLGRLF